MRPIDRRRPIAIYQQLKTILLEEIIAGRYHLVDRVVSEVCRAPASARRSWTDRVDAFLTHRIGGAVAFAAVMKAIFWIVLLPLRLVFWALGAVLMVHLLLVKLLFGGLMALAMPKHLVNH